jgi:hypothetical protein
MKKLFVLVSDGGDGSYNPVFTFNEEWVNAQHDRYDNDGWDEGFLGADGFHYTILTVPDDTTLESLGIRHDCADSEEVS